MRPAVALGPGLRYWAGMKIGLLQLNPLIGDLAGNARKIQEAVRRAASLGAELCVTGELALLGYPPRDLLLYRSVLERTLAEAEKLAAALQGGPALLVGGVEPNPGPGRPAFNCAFFLEGGVVRRSFRKTLLPTYDVFDEDRYFEPRPEGQGNVLEFRGQRIAVTICEDVWNDKEFWLRPRYRRDPLAEAAQAGAGLVVNLSASPFALGKQALRESMLSAAAAGHGTPLVFVNQVGGNDDLVFDGRSAAFGPDGALSARAPGFVEDVRVVDMAALAGEVAADDFSPEAETLRALVLGTRDYVRKSGFKRVLLGLSGGIDSAVTATVAAQALGPENVQGVLMPSPFSSPGSLKDAQELADNLGIETLTLPIETIMRAFDGTLAQAFAGRPRDVTEENIQARIRGNLLMALSNKHGAMLLTTGNKSELAVGYCTIYGDMSGGFGVISDVPKTAVYRLARFVNERFGAPIPGAILTKPPSAELRPNQTDQDSLPPYELLDEILALHVEEHYSAEEIVAAGFDEAVVRRVVALVGTAEFKRRQAAPGIKISGRSFGTGWRMPLACVRPL